MTVGSRSAGLGVDRFLEGVDVFDYTNVSFLGLVIGVIVTIAVLVVVVVIVSAALAGRNGTTRSIGPVAVFLFGFSLVTLAVGLATTGIAVHALSQLVGPSPQSFPGPDAFPPCSVLPASTSIATTTTIPVDGSAFGSSLQSGIPCINVSGQVTIDGTNSNPAYVDQFLGIDDTNNHYISEAVAAGLFALTALVGYLWAWRRAKRLTEETGLGQPPVGRLPIGYAYLVVGLAAVALLVLVPLAADSVFRAIAPGLNETSGHADGLRNLVTFVTVSALSAWVASYYLRYANSLRSALPPPTEDSAPIPG
jgi:hypothetical protein